MTGRRLSQVAVTVNGQNVRRYVLGYRVSPSTKRSLLETVTEYGADDTSTLPQTRFTYQEKPFAFEPIADWTIPVAQFQTGEDWNTVRSRDNVTMKGVTLDLRDMDGDGLADRVMRDASGQYRKLYVQYNLGFDPVAGSGAFSAQTYEFPIDSEPTGGGAETNEDKWRSVHYNDNPGNTYTILTDLNGDSFPERLMRRYAGPTDSFQYQLHRKWGWGLANQPFGAWVDILSGIDVQGDPAWGYPTALYQSSTTITLADMNGDGLADRVMRDHDLDSTDQIYGSSFYVQFNSSVRGGDVGFSGGMTFLDVDGQGQSMTGSGEAWYSPFGVISAGSVRNTVTALFDMNGDGLPDRVMQDFSNATPAADFLVQINNGRGFNDRSGWGPVYTSAGTPCSSCPPVGVSVTGSGGETNALLADINGDGLPDRLMRRDSAPTNYWSVQINNGHGFELPVNWGPIDSQGQNGSSAWRSPQWSDTDGDAHVDLADMDGDGILDRVMRKVSSPYDRLKVERGMGPHPDLLSRIENGIGGSVEIAYRPSTGYDNSDGTYNLLPYPVQTVASVTLRDGFGGAETTSYAYERGMYDPPSREFRGFGRVEVVDPHGTRTVTYFHQGGGYDYEGLGEFADGAAKTGIPFRIEVSGADTPNYSEAVSRVDRFTFTNSSGRSWYFPFVAQTAELEYEGQGGYRARARQSVYDPASGNLVEERSLGEIAAFESQGHTFSDLSSLDNLYTFTAFAGLLNPDVLDRPETVTIASDPDGLVRLQEIVYGYDDRGNLTSRLQWLDTADTYVPESFGYDDRGNQTLHTDAVGITTTTEYETDYRIFPETVTTGTFVTRSTFDVRSGRPLTATNERGLVLYSTYDNFYRRTETAVSTSPDGPPSVWKERWDYEFGGIVGGASRNSVRHRVNDGVDPGNGHETWSYADGLGREVQIRAEAENGRYRVTDVRFDAAGNPRERTYPYFGDGSAHVLPDPAEPKAVTDFDPIRRPFRVTPPAGDPPDSPLGPQEYAYAEPGNPWMTVSTDAAGKSKKTYHDAYGRVVQITEVSGSGGPSTFFEYDRLGRLIRVIDAQGNVSENQFDSLGRKRRTSDPDMGLWTYEHDDGGRVVRQTDANGQATRYFYEDPQGRLTRTEFYNAAGSFVRDVRYLYDLSDDSGYTVFPGQLYKVVDGEGWQKNSYDLRGRLLKTTRFLHETGRSYTIEHSYDDADHITEVGYPGNAARTRYSYDAAGSLVRVESLRGTGTPIVFFEGRGFDEFAQLQGILYGNGVRTDFGYYAESKRLQQILTTGPTGTIQDLRYVYDAVGNVRGIQDAVYGGPASGTLSNIQYDDFHRLLSYQRGGATVAFEYDAVGNILRNPESGPGAYLYGSAAHRHAVTQANGRSYAYDANGNMVRRGEQPLRYDEENRLVSVTERAKLAQQPGGPQAVTFGYAHDGGRLWKRAGGKLTVWIGGHYEERDGKRLCHVIADGRRIATFEPFEKVVPASEPPSTESAQTLPPSSLVYYHGDHLRSSNLITDGAGNPVQLYQYKAYGRERFAYSLGGLSVTHRFTDQILDSETGLYFFQSRYYDPELGRFVQPDNLVPDLDLPQSLNRYSYALNNPLKYVDPSGHFFVELLTAALFYGALSAVQAAIQGEDIWEAFKAGFIQGALSYLFGYFGIPYPGVLAGATTAALQGYDPLAAAVSGLFSQGAGTFQDQYLGVVIGKNVTLGTFLKAAAKELLYNALYGAAAGSATAFAAGGDPLKGAVEGAKSAAVSSGIRIAIVGTKVQLPFTDDELKKEFDAQSANGNSGLGLSLPSRESYNASLGGLIHLIPGVNRTHAFGTIVSFTGKEVHDVRLVAHSLRHVAQFQTLGATSFIKEYITIVDDQIRYSLFGDPGGLYAFPGSSEYGFRLEPGY